MPGKIIMKLCLPEGQKLISSMGSIFHGALMDMLPEEISEVLHSQNLRPYSQFVHFVRSTEEQLWEFGTLTDEIHNIFLEVLLDKETVFLKQKGYELKCSLLSSDFCTYEAMADKVFQGDKAPWGVRISFSTPASFKRDEEYMLFPDTKLIMNSLLNRWRSFAPILLEEENLAETLANCCSISKYELRSQKFYLEGRGITGFVGCVQLGFRGNEMVRRIMGLLMLLAPYSGIGIKTALGMGAVSTELMYRED